MGKYDRLFTDYAGESDLGPVTPESLRETRLAKVRAIRERAGLVGDQDRSKQTYENVRAGLAEPANRDLTMDDIVPPEVQADDISHSEGREFAKFAGAGLAGELVAPVVGRGVSALADKARAIRAARAAARMPAPAYNPNAVAPAETGPTANLRIPNSALGERGSRGGAVPVSLRVGDSARWGGNRPAHVVDVNGDEATLGWVMSDGSFSTQKVPVSQLSKVEPQTVADRARGIQAKRAAQKPDPGITFHHGTDEEGFNDHIVTAMKDGKEIGHAEVMWNQRGPDTDLPMPDGTAQVTSVHVDPAFRRQGIATRLYEEAEKETGRKIVPWAYGQTDQGMALWSSPAFKERVAAAKAIREQLPELEGLPPPGRLGERGSRGGAVQQAAKTDPWDRLGLPASAKASPAERAMEIKAAREMTAPPTPFKPDPNVPVSTKDIAAQFPRASGTVDGLVVREEVPNMQSIEASLDDYDIVPGIREFPMSAFQTTKAEHYFKSADDLARVKRLAAQIKVNGEISPLIVVLDNEGAYVLEGAHRIGALDHLGAKSFPAKIVIDRTDKTGLYEQ